MRIGDVLGIVALVGIVAALAGGCESRLTLGGGCTFTSECAEPNVCAGGRCRAECREDRDCPGGGDTCVRFGGTGGVCTPPATAVPCRLNSDCGAAARCDGGECHAECAVDIDCAGLGTCVAMTCTEAVQTPPASDGGILPGECTGGRVRCPLNLDLCVDRTTSIENCGLCGNGCVFGEVCRGGACVCEPPHVFCGPRCANLMRDVMDCGACDAQCAGGALEVCNEGRCCRADRVWCGTACIPVDDDPANCGGCGVTCAPGEGCRGRSCMAANDTCEGATEIVLDGPVTRYVVSDVRWTNDAISCDPAPDGYFRFSLAAPAIVAIDVRTTMGGEPAVGWVDAACAPTGAACATLCDGDASIDLLSVLGAGDHRFVLDAAFGPAAAPFELTLMAIALPPGVPFDEVPPGTATLDGVIAVGDPGSGVCGATGGDHIYYWLECSTSGGQTTASTCDGTSSLDLVLGLYRSGALVDCAPLAAGCAGGAGAGVDRSAGLYALHVAARDSASGGSYRLTVDRGP